LPDLNPKKVPLSVKVHPDLKDWFIKRAEGRKTSAAEEIRQVLADFREKIISNSED
jgi:hypothetical protein